MLLSFKGRTSLVDDSTFCAISAPIGQINLANEEKSFKGKN